MDDQIIQLLSRIASSLESIAESLSSPEPQSSVFYSEEEWENRDLNELYAEFEEDETDYEADEDWSYEPSFDEPRHDTDREYFNAMTDGMLGDYDDFVDRGGTSDWIQDWSGH